MRRVVSDWTGVRHHPRPCATVGLRPDPAPNIGGRSPFAQRNADQLPTQPHVVLARFPVNNRPGTGELSWRRYPTAAGWSKPAQARPSLSPGCAGARRAGARAKNSGGDPERVGATSTDILFSKILVTRVKRKMRARSEDRRVGEE